VNVHSQTGWSVGIALAALVSVAAPLAHAGVAPNQSQCTSKDGLYRVSYKSQLDPIEINKIMSWVLHVETADGRPVEKAAITVDGGMPAHNHGLPTRPSVTKNMGDGNYLVEGMRFHMLGDWVINITIDASPGHDVCTIALKL
jgi:hypothetical protein